MAKSSKRPLAVFLISKLQKIGSFIVKVQNILQEITDHPLIFVTPSPTVASVTTHLNELLTAEGLAQTRAAGTAAARNLAYDVVLDDIYALQRYVQNLADTAGSTAESISIIEASGFSLKVNGVHVKPALAVKNGDVSGSVKLVAKAAAKRVSYNWQQSLSVSAPWTELPTTLQAKTMVSGLTPGAKVFLRVRPVFKDGPGNWSQSVSIIVQ
jgi:hypothetical protein